MSHFPLRSHVFTATMISLRWDAMDPISVCLLLLCISMTALGHSLSTGKCPNIAPLPGFNLTKVNYSNYTKPQCLSSQTIPNLIKF